MGMTASINKEKTKLTVTIDLIEPRVSKSGKTNVIASTNGNQATTAVYDGHVVTVGLNAYYKD